jgi:hypothetical protein
VSEQGHGNFRAKARDDVDRMYPEIVKAVEAALSLETTKYGDCPKCSKRVPVTFPDLAGRVKAMNFLVEHGYGKPREAIDVEVKVDLERDLDRWKGYIEQMNPEERQVMAGFLRRLLGGREQQALEGRS